MQTLASILSLDTLYVFVTLAIFIAIAFGMAYWVRRAAGDRSALIGLYLVLGFPGILLTLLGLATAPGPLVTLPLKLLLFLAAGGFDVVVRGLVEGYA